MSLFTQGHYPAAPPLHVPSSLHRFHVSIVVGRLVQTFSYTEKSNQLRHTAEGAPFDAKDTEKSLQFLRKFLVSFRGNFGVSSAFFARDGFGSAQKLQRFSLTAIFHNVREHSE